MESNILDKLNKGEKKAFKYIFDMYYKSICVFSQKYMRDSELAEDIAQDVFIKVWEKKLKFPNLVALRAYLYKTAKNKCLNALEHNAVKKKYEEKVIKEEKTEKFFFENLIEQETSRIIIQTIEKLPPQAKKILLLNLEGLKNQEIADQLNISINTVKNHKASAYKFLKETLSHISFLLFFLLK